MISGLNTGSLPPTCVSVLGGSADSVKLWGATLKKSLEEGKDGRQMGPANSLAAFESFSDVFIHQMATQ